MKNFYFFSKVGLPFSDSKVKGGETLVISFGNLPRR
mgnify:CR=1 FL=1